MRGLIMDGVTGSGKTTLLTHLKRKISAALPFDSQIILSEQITDRVFEEDRKKTRVTGSDVSAHISKIIGCISVLHEILDRSKFGGAKARSGMPVIFERFILSHLAADQKTYNVFYVPEALGSPHLPAQKSFVQGSGIRSALGLGGILLPVVILTTSKEDADVTTGYDLGANAYVRKPVDFTQFAEAVKTLGLFWPVINQRARS